MMVTSMQWTIWESVEKRCIFREHWKAVEESASLNISGREFQSIGAKVKNALNPNCFFMCLSSTLGMHEHDRIAKRRHLPCVWWGMSFWSYWGAVLFKLLYARDITLQSIYSFTGSQWNSLRTVFMRSVFFVHVIFLAAVFWTSWRRQFFVQNSPQTAVAVI